MGDPVSYALFRSRRLDRWLKRIDAMDPPVAIVTHSSNISTYAVDQFRRTHSTEPGRILHFADVDSEKFLAYARDATGLKRWLFRSEAARVRREERRLAAGADFVAFVSDEEADLFRSILPTSHSDRVVTLPNGVDTAMFSPDRFPSGANTMEADFVFTGAMDYPPNVEAVKWFAREVFPRVRAAVPGARFVIVGSRPASDVRRLAADAIMVTGRVDSVVPYLARARVAVAPLRLARGVQNKVMEAMAMAKPVVVSRGALTGIGAFSGEHLVCADSANNWVDACVDLATNAERAYRLGQNARRLMVERYSWDAQFARLDRLLEIAQRLRHHVAE
jgi:sugar transferase (PEP-CTERM/EpsH1 system associated)